MKIFIFMLSIIFSSTLLGYDGKKCAQMIFGGADARSWPFGITSSTTSFFSSTGDCALIGYHSQENKEMYYAQNELELQLDIAKGEGAYLTELTSIYGCSEGLKVNKALMRNYQAIYDSKKPSNAVDSVMQTQNCKHL